MHSILEESMTSNELKDIILDIYGDLYVYCPTYYFAEKFNRNNRKLFLYSMEVRASKPMQKSCKGICHTEELHSCSDYRSFKKDTTKPTGKYRPELLDFGRTLQRMGKIFNLKSIYSLINCL